MVEPSSGRGSDDMTWKKSGDDVVEPLSQRRQYVGVDGWMCQQKISLREAAVCFSLQTDMS